ncbi:MAG: HAMP domain-containing protein [Planctomycetes bacterium]|nr:HAMP domain-containing protein [Planctomycetota bacterium]
MLFGRLRDVFQTLRFRLMLWVTLVVSLITLAALLTVHQFVYNTLLNEFDQRLKDDIGEVASSIRQNPIGPDLHHALNVKARNHSLRGWFVQLYDADHNLIWATDDAPNIKHALLYSDRLMALEEGPLRIVQSRFEPPSRPAVIIRLGSTMESVIEDIDLLNWIMILAGASILILAPVVGYLLAGRALRPLAWIIATTARLQPKKLDERLPVRGTGDELDQLSRTINGMLDRIAAHLGSSNDFIANAAHELRSPLAAIRSSVEVALDRLRTPDEYAALLVDVADETSRLGNLVNRLLLLAEGDAGRLEGADQTAQLDGIVRESVEMFGAVAESVGVEIEIAQLDRASVPGDDFHLRQVVRNLLDNAIKFTPPEGRVHVSLQADVSHEMATLVVRDTGIGIPPEDLPRIFERFYRVDKSRQRQSGTGLGLAICHAIVNALGGSIHVESVQGKGSAFTVVLPMQRSVEGKSGSSAAA